MFKKPQKRSTPSRRVRVARSVATSRADTATGPRPIVFRPPAAVAERGPSRSRARSPEQSTEPLPACPARSHSQDREVRMSTNPPAVPGPSALPVAAGIDVAKAKLDLALDEQGEVLAFPNDAAGIARLLERRADAKPQVIVVESTGGLERALVDALLDSDLPVALVHPGRVRYF